MGRRFNNIGDIDSNENNKNEENKKSNKRVIRLIIWLVIFAFICYQVYLMVAYTIGINNVNKDRMWLYNGLNSVMALFNDTAKETTSEYELSIAALGDVYASPGAITAAKSGTTYNFSDGTNNVKGIVSKYDFVIASLNSPIGNTTMGYTAKTTYSTPKEMLQALKDIGVTTLATATHHMYDKTDKGVQNTIASIKEVGLEQTGINETSESSKPLVISKNEIKLGVLSYLTKSNVKIPATKDYLINILDEARLKKDVEYLKSQNVDYILAYVATPNEDDTLISSEQKSTIEMLFNNGVNIVFGSGTVFVQDKVEDLLDTNDTTKSHVYSMYSLGDFYGIASSTKNQMSAIANVKFTKTIVKDKKGNVIAEKTKSNMFVGDPILLYSYIKAGKRTIWDLSEFIKAYGSDKSKFEITSKVYNEIVTEKERLDDII